MKYFLLGVLTVTLFYCSNNKNESSTNDNSAIRFDGLYASKKLEHEVTGDGYRSFLKFYKNGTVINVSSSGTPEEVSKWFKQGHDMVSEGEYEIDKENISFTVKSKNGSVKYNGTIASEEKLKLHSKSLINDFEDDVTYSFVEE